jgi:aminopeptidase S
MLTATYSPAAPDPGSADFALNVSPTAFVLAAGTSISITVNTTTLQGGPQSIALAVGGLPANVTGVLSPAIVTSGQSATLTLTAAANAVLGDKAITVTGAAGLVAHQVVAVLSVVP